MNEVVYIASGEDGAVGVFSSVPKAVTYAKTMVRRTARGYDILRFYLDSPGKYDGTRVATVGLDANNEIVVRMIREG